VAELLKKELGVETNLVEGDRGEFTVWVDDEVVAKKGWLGFPDDEKVLEAVRSALTAKKSAGHGS
jgi:predicted Rdx family selenoprotein